MATLRAILSQRIVSEQRLHKQRIRRYDVAHKSILKRWKDRFGNYYAGKQGVVQLFITTDAEVEFLFESIIKGERRLSPGQIDTDTKIMGLFLWLYGEREIIQVPLETVTRVIARVTERLVATHTYCFVYDAAAGNSEIVCDVLEAATKNDGSIQCIRNSGCLYQWAMLYNQGLVDTEALYALICLHTSVSPRTRTLLFTIPTAIVPILLPALDEQFPDDRHIFLYTGCVQAVAHRQPPDGRRNASGSAYNTLADYFLLEHNPSLYHTPVSDDIHKVTKSSFGKAISALSLSTAATTECWMSAVDVFLARKKLSQQGGSSYFPYVCKYDYMVQLGYSLEIGSPLYWAVRSLLQYVQTGVATPDMPILAGAASILRNAVPNISYEHQEKENIHAAVSCHGRILIPNATLDDTVAPIEDWSVKQRKEIPTA